MKSRGINNSTMRVAVCSMISALSLVLMLLTILPIGTYAFPCFAGILLIAIVVEYKCKWAMLVYAVVSILSLFLVRDKEAVVFFIMLFGYYPILKNLIESKFQPKFGKVAGYILKFIIFNAAAISAFLITTFLLAIPAEEYTLFGFYVPWVFLVIGNFFFAIYDYAVSVFVAQYVCRLRNKIFNKK
ncbi:MAG: hypothetical protein J1E85_05220 [Ruminococcus sp.]|nr:hypothetical protein [Ruminococcus sp.]